MMETLRPENMASMLSLLSSTFILSYSASTSARAQSRVALTVSRSHSPFFHLSILPTRPESQPARTRDLRLRSMASAEAKNLEAISKAIDQHNANCPYPAAEVRMNPFEVERLGWDQIRGLPVVPDPEIGTGRFRIVCSRDLDGEGLEETEAVGRELETVTPSGAE
jgi:hypothetical protein